MAGNIFPYFTSSKHFDSSNVQTQIFQNKCHLTKGISGNTSKIANFLPNVIEMKFKSTKLPENQPSLEAIKVQSDMSTCVKSYRPVLHTKWKGIT